MITLSNSIEQIHFFGRKCMVKTNEGLIPLNEPISYLVKYLYSKKMATLNDIISSFIERFSVVGDYQKTESIITNFLFSSKNSKELFCEFESSDHHNSIEVSGAEGRYVPYLLNIELTNKCNLNCSHCYKEANCHLVKDIDLNRLSCLFSFLKSTNLSITLTGGEPTLHPKFEEAVKLCSEYGKVDIVTNGINLKSVAPDILRSINLIGISLYGTDDITYKKNTRINNGFTKLEGAIDYLHSIGKEFIITIVLDKEKIINLDTYLDTAEHFGAKNFQIGLPSKMGKLMEKNDQNEVWDISDEEKKYAYKKIREYQKKCTKIRVLEWKREVYEKKYSFDDPNNPSNFYETHCMKCGAGTTQWSISESFNFRPCNFMCNEFAKEINYEDFKKYVDGKYIIDWIKYMKEYEKEYSKSGNTLSDCCRRMTDFLNE